MEDQRKTDLYNHIVASNEIRCKVKNFIIIFLPILFFDFCFIMLSAMFIFVIMSVLHFISSTRILPKDQNLYFVL